MALGPFFIGEKIPFTFTIRDKDTDDIIDLTGISGSTANSKTQVLLRKIGATTNRHTGSDQHAYAPTPTNGQVIYTMPTAWSTGETGQWDAQIIMNFSTGVRKSERFRFTVEDALE